MAKVIGPALFIAANVVSGGSFAWAAPYLLGAGIAVSIYQQKSAARKAARNARDAYNAGLTDRMQMVDLRPDAPRTLALGRVRAVEGIRRRWVSGTNSEKMTLIVSFAGHEIDAFETFWFNDTPLTIDGSGYVQTAPYLKGDKASGQASGTLGGTGAASVTLSSAPVSGSLWAIWSTGTGESTDQGALTIGGTGVNITLSGGPAGAPYYVTYQTTTGTSTARIRSYLGTAAQNVGADLAAEYPGKITSADRFAGIALAVIDLDYDPDVYPQGIPNITATFRGAKCLDPRTSTTVWTENPALHAYHYARHANGWAVPVGEIRTQDIIDAANFADTSTVFDMGGGDTATLPRYRCGITIPTDADPRSSMDEIMETMAGRWGWAGGTLRMRCGRMASSVWAMDESWIAQRVGADGQPEQSSVVRITNGVPREAKVNRVTGRCVDPDQRYQVLPFPAVQDAVLIADDGAEYPLEVEYQGVNHIAHAQHLGKIRIREGQAPLRMDASCNLSAYRLELFDVGTVTVARYGFSAKTFEATGWHWHPTEGVQLSLAEITADIFSTEALTGRDPAPNGDLPPPWSVAAIAGVAVNSGTTTLTDGSILTRTHITWTQPLSQAVLVGGQIEVQYLEASIAETGDWPSWTEPGSASGALIPGLLTGRYYVFRVRAINSLGVRGPWSAQVSHKIAAPPASGATPLLRLTATSIVMSFDAAGAALPASQTITLQAQLTNLVGTATFVCTRYNSSGVSIGTVTLGGSGNTRTLTETQFGAAAYATVGITVGAYSDGLTITRVQSGANGTTSAQVRLFQRTGSLSAPALPSSTLTYTFASGGLSGSLGSWTTTIPSSGGKYVWTTQALATGNGATDTIAPGEWSAASIQSTDGDPGTAGSSGNSAVRAYALYTGNPVVSGSAIVKGGTALPDTTSWSPTAASSWTATTQTPASGQSMFQSDGVFNPVTNQTTWQVPYLSNFKVGSLSALAADLGTVNAGNITGTANISISGTATFGGANAAQSMQGPGGLVSYTTAVLAGFSGSAQVGLAGKSAAASGFGLYGENTSSSGQGVVGYGTEGVLGIGRGSFSVGVRGLAGTSGKGGVFVANGAGATGVQIIASGGALGIDLVGSATLSGQLTSTAVTGSAPFVIASTTLVSNLNADLLKGKTWATPDPIGSTTAATGAFTTLTASGRLTLTASGTPLVLPSISSFPAAVVGGVVAHASFGLCVSDGVNWYGASALTIRG